jgi:hypothetical protein
MIIPYAKEPYQSLHRLLGQSGKVSIPDANSVPHSLIVASVFKNKKPRLVGGAKPREV